MTNNLRTANHNRKTATMVLPRAAAMISVVEGLFFGNDGPEHPPVFVLGLPRGGTTLVYQVLCHAFELSFTPMITNTIPFAPSFASKPFLKRCGRFVSDFQSHYGESRGFGSPGESTVWNLYFNKDHRYDNAAHLQAWMAKELVRFVGRLERMGGGPFINKNLRHAHRLGALLDLFPDAVFLIVLRHPRDSGLSLLRGRIENMGNPNALYSIRPRCEKQLFQKPPEQSVAAQVRGIVDDLAHDIRRLGQERFGVILYEGFCSSTRSTLQRLSVFARRRGLFLQNRNEVPHGFHIIRNRIDRLTLDQVFRLDQALANEFPEPPFADFPGCWLTEAAV